MPNGISCAYFAARNHIYGKKEDNPFKKGIAGIQTARTVDSVVKTGSVAGPFGAPVTNFVSGVASVGRKIVYPLIIGSGIYNTVKSDDKVMTGTSQALGISTMYCFEKVAEKGLNSINNMLSKSEKFTNNKFAKGAWYVAKGLAFVMASLSGYDTGSKIGESLVNKCRNSNNSINNEKDKLEPQNKSSFPIEEGLNDSQIFTEIEL